MALSSKLHVALRNQTRCIELSSIISHNWIALHPIFYAYNKGMKELSSHEAMQFPHNLTFPINTHRMAHNTPTIENNKNPLFIPVLLAPVTGLSTATLALRVFSVFSFNLLKLDIRSKARLTFSEADAGVVGIDSTNAHKLEENQLAESPPAFVAVWFSVVVPAVPAAAELTDSYPTPKQDQKVSELATAYCFQSIMAPGIGTKMAVYDEVDKYNSIIAPFESENSIYTRRLLVLSSC